MESPGTRNCVSCGRGIAWDANVCPYCGHDYRMRMMPAPRARSPRARTGGALILVAGILAIGNGIAEMALSTMSPDSLGITLPEGITTSQFQELLAVVGIVAVVLGFISIMGGIFAFQKRRFAWAVAGGITGLFGIGFVIGAVLAVVGLILIALARDEFGQAVHPESPYPVR